MVQKQCKMIKHHKEWTLEAKFCIAGKICCRLVAEKTKDEKQNQLEVSNSRIG